MSNNPKETSVDLSKLTKEKVKIHNSINKSDKKLITKLNESQKLIGHEIFSIVERPEKPKKTDKK